MLRIVRYLSKAEIGQMLVALVSIVGQIWLDLTLPDYMADITQLVETPGSEMHDIWVAGGKMLLVSLGSAACAVPVASNSPSTAPRTRMIPRCAMWPFLPQPSRKGD